MGIARPLKGTLCCCQSAQASSPQVRNSIWQRKEKCGTFCSCTERGKKLARPDIGARHCLESAGRSNRSAAARPRRAKQRLGALGRVYVEAILTDTDLWPCSASFAEISAGLIEQGSHTVSKLPLCPSRFLCRKPNAVKSPPTSYGGRCPSRGILI